MTEFLGLSGKCVSRRGLVFWTRHFCALLFAGVWLFDCVALWAAPAPLTVHSLYLEGGTNRAAYAVVRGEDGLLWMASDNGLLRYDGYQLQEFTPDQSDEEENDERLDALLLDSDGTIWTGSSILGHFDPVSELFTSYDIGLEGENIWALVKDSQGILWLAGAGFGLKGFDVNRKALVHDILRSPQRHAPANTISALVSNPGDHRIWMAADDGLWLFDPLALTFEPVSLPQSFSTGSRGIRDLLPTEDGTVWLATDHGLLVIDPADDGTRIIRPGGASGDLLGDSELWSLYRDSSGHIWIGTDKEGVFRYDATADRFLHVPASRSAQRTFPTSSIVDIFEDTSGNLWFATGYYGVHRISEHLEKFTVFTHDPYDDNSLGLDNILDLHQDRNGVIWIATDGGGLDRFDPETGKFRHFAASRDEANSISSNSVVSIADDDNGILWIGTWSGGLNRFDPVTESFSRIATASASGSATAVAGQAPAATLTNDNVFLVAKDPSGWLWLSLHGQGLQLFNPASGQIKTFLPSDQPHHLRSSVVLDIEPSRKGGVWIGGNAGLEYFDRDRESFVPGHIDRLGTVYDVLEEPAGSLWIATARKLVYFDPATGFTESFTTREGLANNYVTSLIKDEDGCLWIGTRGGLSRFDPVKREFLNFGKDDGLAGAQLNRLSNLRTDRGELYFGSFNGLIRFVPHAIPKNREAPAVVITNIEVFRDHDNYQYYDQSKSQKISASQELIVPYHSRDLTFEFAALDFHAPAKNRYRFRLKNLETSWTEVDSSRRQIRYTSLPPGDYVFQVHGSNSDGVWSLKPAEKKLTILPPPWLTWWAQTLAVTGITILVVWMLLTLSRRHERRRQELERLVEEKTADLIENRKLSQHVTRLLEQERKSIASEIHDNINSVIIATRMVVQSIERASRSPGANADTIGKLADKADGYLAETYDFFRALVRKLRPEIIETLGFIGAVNELIQNYNNIHPTCEFKFHNLAHDTVVGEDVGIELYRIVQEAITNAIKHAQAKEVSVMFRVSEKQLILTVTDDGVGFYFHRDPGVGIAHMRERALSLNGEFSIRSGAAEPGTRIEVIIPRSRGR